MKVVVKNDNCIGCGACEATCPEVFQINDDGISQVICEDFSAVDEETLTDAMEGCPTGAIEEEEKKD